MIINLVTFFYVIFSCLTFRAKYKPRFVLKDPDHLRISIMSDIVKTRKLIFLNVSWHVKPVFKIKPETKTKPEDLCLCTSQRIVL